MGIGVTDIHEHLRPFGGWNTLSEVSESAGHRTGRSRILIVQASDTRAEEMKAALGSSEYDFVEAGATSEAIAALSRQRIDLVLVDYTAPEHEALDLCRIVKKSSAMQLLPVFVVGATDDLEAEVRALDAGANEFLLPPLRPRSFQARVQASLRRKAMIDSLDDSEAVLISLAQSVEERDLDLGQHCTRLAVMASTMGMAIGLPTRDILALQRGGYLHDIGKISVPDNVLFKPGPLNSDEWEMMKTHVLRGERICSGMKSLAGVLPIIRHHHERWDGSGYPDGLRGEEIPLLARILQLADIYDALTTARPYKAALTPAEAVAVIRQEAQKGWRDAGLVEMFADILPMFRNTACESDLSRLSLHALVESIESYRKDANRAGMRSGKPAVAEEFRLAS